MKETMIEVYKKCWSDPDFKARFLASPETVLREEGFDIPDDVTVNVAENTEKIWNVTIPHLPAVPAEVIGDEFQADVVGQGTGFATCPSGSTPGTCGSTCN